MAYNRISRNAAGDIQGFPACCIISRTTDAAQNEDILYNLVVATDGTLQSVKSADGIVNVIPPNRVYYFNTVEQLDAFKLELLKRPTVVHFTVSYIGCPLLQRIHPVLTCGNIQRTENWILLIHQLHPKILSRIQMGFDRARSHLFWDQPFFLHLDFNEALTRHFHSLWMKYEGSRELLDIRVKIEGAEIIVSHTRVKKIGLPKELIWRFEDLTLSDFKVRRPADAVKIIGATSYSQKANENDLRQRLPGWQFSLNPDDPMNTMARSRYSYATANRMIVEMIKVSSSIEEESAI